MALRAEVRNLWRRVIQVTNQMPQAQSNYYWRFAKQNFISWEDEEDPDFIAKLIKKGHSDVDYIVKKYQLDKPGGNKWTEEQFTAAAFDLGPSGGAEPAGGTDPAPVQEVAQRSTPEEDGKVLSQLHSSALSRPLNGIVVEADVVGNLIVKELHDKARGTQRTSLLQSAPASSHARAAPKPKLLLSDVRDGAVCGSAIAVGDVLVEIDGESVRGKDPGTMSVRRGTHAFKFGRRQPTGPIYFEVTIEAQNK